jgi:hypothetical protein
MYDIFIPVGEFAGVYSIPESGPWIKADVKAGEAIYALAGNATGGSAWFSATNANFFDVAPIAGEDATRFDEVFMDVGQVSAAFWLSDSLYNAPGVATQAEVNGWGELIYVGLDVSAVIQLDDFDPEQAVTLPGTLGGKEIYENNRYLIVANETTLDGGSYVAPDWQGFYEFTDSDTVPERLTAGPEGSGVGNWDNVPVAKVRGYGEDSVGEFWVRGYDRKWRLMSASYLPDEIDADNWDYLLHTVIPAGEDPIPKTVNEAISAIIKVLRQMTD